MAKFIIKRGVKARPRIKRQVGELNSIENEYAAILQEQQCNSQIVHWRFEPFKLRLADMTYYTIDFMVLELDGTITLIECKAMTSKLKLLIEDDANVKFKVAAEQFPEFLFKMVARKPKKIGGGWETVKILNS